MNFGLEAHGEWILYPWFMVSFFAPLSPKRNQGAFEHGIGFDGCGRWKKTVSTEDGLRENGSVFVPLPQKIIPSIGVPAQKLDFASE